MSIRTMAIMLTIIVVMLIVGTTDPRQALAVSPEFPIDVTVGSRASGGFGYPVSGWDDMVEAGTFSTGEELRVTATGTVYTSSLPGTGPDGFTYPAGNIEIPWHTVMPLEEKQVDAGTWPDPRPDPATHLGALMAAFVPSAIASAPDFLPRDDDYVGDGNGISSAWLFLVGAGPTTLTVPEDSVLYLGINDPYMSNNSGSFDVTIIPEPATLSLLVLGGGCALLRRRRRA